jgi:TetR/AcrR family transcriptional regulator
MQQPVSRYMSRKNSPGQGSQTILAAARRLFAEHGFDAVSLNAIAERAGVSKANIFHHFGSKEALYLAVMRDVCSRTSELLHAFVTESGTFSERIHHFARAHLRHLIDNAGVSQLILREIVAGDARRGRELVEKVFGDNFSRLVEIFRAGQQRGEVRNDVDPAVLAMALIGANVFFFQNRHILWHFSDIHFADDPDYYSRAMCDLLLNGMRAPSRRNGGSHAGRA